MFAWQYGPENEMGPTRNTNSAGTTTVDASTLHAAAHADWNACVAAKQISYVATVRVRQ